MLARYDYMHIVFVYHNLGRNTVPPSHNREDLWAADWRRGGVILASSSPFTKSGTAHAPGFLCLAETR